MDTKSSAATTLGRGRFLKVSIFLTATGILFAIHYIVFAPSEILPAYYRRFVGFELPDSFVSGVMVLALFVLIFSFIALFVPKDLRHDTELHNIVYYLGFMSTLLALILSSYGLMKVGIPNALNPSPNLGKPAANNPIELVVQNGLALVATLAGVFFRNLLRYLYPPQQKDIVARWNELTNIMRTVDASLVSMNANIKTFQEQLPIATNALKQQSEQWTEFSNLTQSIGSNLGTAAGHASTVNSALTQGAAVGAQLGNGLAQTEAAVRTLLAQAERLNRAGTARTSR